jgi:hypothetical protein
MAELSFVVAHGLAVLVLLERRAGLEVADLVVALAVLMPAMLAQAALMLPRFLAGQGFHHLSWRQTAAAWVAALLFVVVAWLIIREVARKGLLFEQWHLAATLGALEAVYGIYAAWFFQSRAVFNERQGTALRQRLARQEFDVFLCHNSRDKDEVKAIAVRLMERGVKPWLDEWELRPGFRWQPLLEEQIRQVKSAAVFVGADGVGPWQSEEIGGFLSACVRRGIPVIPVVLPNAPETPELPPFLAERTWVDFRKSEPNPLDRLLFGISGRHN